MRAFLCSLRLAPRECASRQPKRTGVRLAAVACTGLALGCAAAAPPASEALSALGTISVTLDFNPGTGGADAGLAYSVELALHFQESAAGDCRVSDSVSATADGVPLVDFFPGGVNASGSSACTPADWSMTPTMGEATAAAIVHAHGLGAGPDTIVVSDKTRTLTMAGPDLFALRSYSVSGPEAGVLHPGTTAAIQWSNTSDVLSQVSVSFQDASGAFIPLAADQVTVAGDVINVQIPTEFPLGPQVIDVLASGTARIDECTGPISCAAPFGPIDTQERVQVMP